MNETLRAGFIWTIEIERNGVVIDREVIHNMLPGEAVTYIMGTAFKGSTQVPTWYLAPYEGNYVPQATDTAATFPASATECTAYSETTRQEWIEGSIVTGALDNTASVAQFTFTSAKTIYGGFMTSNSAKGATSGTLASLVRFSSPKTPDVGDVLRMIAGFTLTSI